MGSPKARGTTEMGVQATLRWSANRAKADEICCYNRHYAEHSGYFLRTPFEEYMRAHGESPVVFYDSVTGLPLYVAPVGRSVEDFLKESRAHGWRSFLLSRHTSGALPIHRSSSLSFAFPHADVHS